MSVSDDDFSLSSDDDFEVKKTSKTKQKVKVTNTVSKQAKKENTPSKRPLQSPEGSGVLKKAKDTPLVNAAVGAPLMSSACAMTKGPPVSSAAEGRSLIKSYMIAQNRPYSVIQIYDNLHHRVTKPDVQRGVFRQILVCDFNHLMSLYMCSPG